MCFQTKPNLCTSAFPNWIWGDKNVCFFCMARLEYNQFFAKSEFFHWLTIPAFNQLNLEIFNFKPLYVNRQFVSICFRDIATLYFKDIFYPLYLIYMARCLKRGGLLRWCHGLVCPWWYLESDLPVLTWIHKIFHLIFSFSSCSVEKGNWECCWVGLWQPDKANSSHLHYVLSQKSNFKKWRRN